MRIKVTPVLGLLLSLSNGWAEGSLIVELEDVVRLVESEPHCAGQAICWEYYYRGSLAPDQAMFGSSAALPPAPGGITPAQPGTPGSLFKDYFTLFDVAGLIPQSLDYLPTNPPTWGVLISPTGPRPSTVSVSDDPAVLNLTLYAEGEDLGGPGGASFGFLFRSLYPPDALNEYAVEATWRTGANAGFTTTNVGTVQGPGSVQVSEPPVGLWLAAGLVMLPGLRRS